AGVRTRTVTPESLQHWRRNGCTKVYYGIESGSQTMLDVMEKNTMVEANINALKWTYEAGLGTIVQLVIGMPGETDRTIYETIDFLKTISRYSFSGDDNSYPSDLISINYAQALPGTPLYEYAREHGFIGKTLEEEEKYLLKISDTDAYKEDHFINYTGQPLLKVLMWRYFMLAKLDAYFLKQRKMKVYMPLQEVLGYYIKITCVRFARKLGTRNWSMPVAKRILPQIWLARFAKEKSGGEQKEYNFVTDSGYFNIHGGLKFAPLLLNPFTRRFFYPLMAMAVAVQHLVSPLQSVKLLLDHVIWSLLKGAPPEDLPTKSLRKIVPAVSSRHEDKINSMLPLRAGR
ncbi:radical SAM protein, partial [Acidobacteria bacterium AH-259-O06]|nr:radical SAM protein [Acidobacteria bacterium AH-259-O06]